MPKRKPFPVPKGWKFATDKFIEENKKMRNVAELLSLKFWAEEEVKRWQKFLELIEEKLNKLK